MKKIIIINGSGGVGKDTFVNCVSHYIDAIHLSIATPSKEIAKLIGWDGSKEEKDRKFLSDIKKLIDEYNDFNYKKMAQEMQSFLKSGTDNQLLFIDMREKNQIERAVKDFGAVTLLITRNSVKHITSNMADAGVFDFNYDYIIKNDGTIDDLDKKAKQFVSMLSVTKDTKKETKSDNKNKPKKLIYISHPFGGKDVNLDLVKKYIKFLTKLFPEYIFISPILTFGCLYHEVDYETGLEMCLRLLEKCDEMWVTGDYKTSKGCLKEIEYCKNKNIDCKYIPIGAYGLINELREVLKYLW